MLLRLDSQIVASKHWMRSVPEVPVACRHQSNAVLVAAVNHVLIAHAPTGVGNCRDASLACLLH